MSLWSPGENLCCRRSALNAPRHLVSSIVPLDLSEPDFLPVLADATSDLDVGLVVSNAGTGSPGRFLDKSREELMQLLRLNTILLTTSANGSCGAALAG
jgi:short-subunit dehydrogenase